MRPLKERVGSSAIENNYSQPPVRSQNKTDFQNNAKKAKLIQRY